MYYPLTIITTSSFMATGLKRCQPTILWRAGIQSHTSNNIVEILVNFGSSLSAFYFQ